MAPSCRHGCEQKREIGRFEDLYCGVTEKGHFAGNKVTGDGLGMDSATGSLLLVNNPLRSDETSTHAAATVQKRRREKLKKRIMLAKDGLCLHGVTPEWWWPTPMLPRPYFFSSVLRRFRLSLRSKIFTKSALQSNWEFSPMQFLIDWIKIQLPHLS